MSNKEIEKLQYALDSVSETDILISIKQTEYYKGNGKNKRYGRFNMDSLEHKILKRKEGYYFFMLFSGQYFLGAKIVKAEKIKFANQISWKSIIKLEKEFRNLEGFLNG